MSAMATTPMRSNAKSAMSRAVPRSFRVLRFAPFRFTSLHPGPAFASLVGIHAPPAAVEFNKPGRTGLSIRHGSHNNKRDPHGAHVPRRIVRGGGRRAVLREAALRVADIGKNRHRRPAWKHGRIVRLKLGDLRRGCVVHDILDVGSHDSG